MEKKTTRRIVGILVIVALVIILLPLLFTGNEQSSSTRIAEMKPVPTPMTAETTSTSLKPTIAQAPVSPVPTTTPQPTTQATAATSLNLPAPSSATQAPSTSPLTSAATTPTMNTSAQPTTPSSVVTVVPPLQQSQSKKSTVEPVLSSTQAKKSPVIDEEPQAETIKLLDNEKVSQHTEIFHPANVSNKNSTYRSHVKTAAAPISDTADNDDLVAKQDLKSVKKPAWAVQLGSFKNKDNVKRLIGLLRSKGYKVFTYQAKISGQTRVCVGPEFKHTSALSLAKKLERDTKIHGIVISYNPLDT